MSKTLSLTEQDYANSGWLQALMGVSDPVIQQSRLIAKKHLDWIDCITSLTTIREKAEMLDVALDSLWQYGVSNELKWLLTSIPCAQSEWVLDCTDEFSIKQDEPPKIDNATVWANAMGICDWSTQVTMRILSGDFVSWQRRVARQGSNAPTEFTMESSGKRTLELKTTASWKANNWVDGTWTFAIDGQATMVKVIEEPISVYRPDTKATQENVLLTIQSADERFAKLRKKNSGNNITQGMSNQGKWAEWCESVSAFDDLHLAVLCDEGLHCSPTFQGIWATVWPIIYCRRKKLKRGTCGLTDLRQRLDQCFQADPLLVTWLLVFGELLCKMQIGDGLGISAKFKDR
ncbi:MAG TPA: hypothetical protein VM260_08290 [Pirellula sp.]|nr:hypothetical protein [Pirellula sp.]